MRSPLRALAVAAVLGSLAFLPAGAQAEEKEGTIARMDTNIGAIILTDGTQIMLPEEFNVEGLDPGKHIYVDFDVIDGQKVAQIIEIIGEDQPAE
ncbi:hypothetical protein GGD81_002967 [Rhodobium orientis]|nr:DUF1344 domain-containing protein [Rhodobium orientis]MBB4303915.1 hypothetical protein [Rhodobium orientis]